MNSIFINGAHVALGENTFNVYDMLHIVRSELEKLNQLNSFKKYQIPLSSSGLSSLQKLATSLASDDGNTEKHTARVDVSRGAKNIVTFVNNIEKDVQYRHWSKKLTVLLQPAWQIHQIRRNLYTVVVTPDILTYDGALLVYQFDMLMSQQYPIRVGYVPVCDTTATGTGTGIVVDSDDKNALEEKLATASDICSLFAIIRDKYSNAAAGNFLSKLAEGTLQRSQQKQQLQDMLDTSNANAAAGKQPSGEYGATHEEEVISIQRMIDGMSGLTIKELPTVYATVVSEYVSEHGSKEIKVEESLPNAIREAIPKLPATNSGYRQEARNILKETDKGLVEYINEFHKNVTTYLYNRGLQTNTYSMNGIVEKSLDLQRNFMQILAREQQMMTRWYQEEAITDKTKSLFTQILSLNKAYPRYHPLLEQTGGNVEYVNVHKSKAWDIINDVTNYMYSASHSDVTYFATTLLSIPPSKAGFQALQSALMWLQQQAIVTDDTNTHRVGQRFGYYFATRDDMMSCFDDSSKNENTCPASAASAVAYYQAASIIAAYHRATSMAKTENISDFIQLTEIASSATTTNNSADIVVSLVDILPTLKSFDSLSIEDKNEILSSGGKLLKGGQSTGSDSLFSGLRKLNEINR